MRSLSGLEIGLSFVSGIILLGLIGEVYHFFWWKRRLMSTNNNTELMDGSKNYAPLFSYFFCWKSPNLSQNRGAQELNPTENSEVVEDLEMGRGTRTGRSTDALLKGFVGEEEEEEDNVDVIELMRLHNLWGPPRFLFTIKEETKEDLEDAKSRNGDSRSRKGSRTRSLSDVVFSPPLASPTIKSSSLSRGGGVGVINPLFETYTESDLNKFRSSPPPKFKFLRDAEDKLIKRLLEESERRKAIIKDQDSGLIHNSGPSKVIPLASSPSTTISPIKQ